ncbi:MAG: UDPGP type 1 family protein [Myxococcota bacterium]|nr:UDPGP type 1 family protein [Myxococcota bacterium]
MGEAYERFVEAGQGHVFRFWSSLSAEERDALRAQLESVDPARFVGILDRTRALAERELPDLEPAVVERHPARGGSQAGFDAAREAGEAELRAGRVAALVVAGGQGTRLGHPGPKGTFPIGPVGPRSLFELQASRIRGLERRHGRTVPWLVMTSPSTDAATRRFFEEHDHFGLGKGDVLFFSQGEIPCVDFEGRFLLAEPGRLATSPDGHGGVIGALARSGCLDALADRGITTLSYYQVDNPLLRIGDPVLIGFHVSANAEFTTKIVAKNDPAERVGSIARSEGRHLVIEYTEIREPHRSARDEDGELVHWAGGISAHVLDTGFLARAAANEAEWLPEHASAKKIPHVDDAGDPVVPDEPNGYKLERFVFDVLPHASRVSIVEALREEEYSPVKNALGGESPDTARAALSAHARRLLREAGIEEPPPGDWIELDPEWIDGAEDLRALGIRRYEDAPRSILLASGGTA